MYPSLLDLSSSLTKTQATPIRHFWKLKYFSTFPGAWKYLENKRFLSWDDMNSDGSDGEGKHRNDFLERKKWFLPTKPPLCSVAIKQTYSSTTCPICCRKTPCCWPAEHWSRWNCQIRRQRVVSGQKRAVAAAAASPVQCSVPVLSNLLRKILISQISQHEIFLQFYRRGTPRVSTPRYTEYLPLTRTITQSGDAEWTRGISLPRSWWWRWNRMFKCGFQKGLFCHYTLLKSTPNSGQLHILLILLLMSSAGWTTLHNWPYVRCSAK